MSDSPDGDNVLLVGVSRGSDNLQKFSADARLSAAMRAPTCFP